MAVQEITVADALVRVKTTKARIDAAMGASFVAVRQNGRVPAFASPQAFQEQAQREWQSINALLANYAALKAAIVQSNATTMVQIGQERMTVAAAIERKQSIQYEKDLLTRIVQQLSQARRSADQANAQVQQRADQQAVAFFGDKADKSADQYQQFIQQFVRTNGADVVDPIGLDQVIARMQQRIEDFEANVDLQLTTSNVVTTVSVDL